MGSPDKRIATRIDCNKLVYVKGINSEGQIATGVMGRILNISKSGLRIEAPMPFNTELILVSTLDHKDKAFGIRSKIVYTEKNPAGGYLLGNKFQAPEESCVKFIKAVVRAYYAGDRHDCVDIGGSDNSPSAV
jgi:hypothetical protein